MRATISLLGLYNYDNSILDGLTLPSNFTSEDLATLKTNLLMETAEFELLYSDFNFLKFAIAQWCDKRKSTWKWLKDTQLYEYNPLENVHMHLDDHLGSKLEKDVITDFERNLKSAKTGHDDFDSDVHKTGHDDFDSDVHKTGHDDFDSDVHKTGHDDFDSDVHKTGHDDFDSDVLKTGHDDFDSNVHKTGHDDFDSDVHKTGDDKDEKRGSDTLLHSVYALDENLTPSPESGDTTSFNSDLKTTYDNNVNTDSSTTYNNNVNTDSSTTYNNNVNTDSSTTYNNNVNTDSSTTYNNNVNTDSSTTYNNNVNTDSSTTYNNNVNTDSTTTYNNVVDDTGTTKNTVDHDESLKKNYNKDWSGRDHITAQELIKQEQELAMFNILDFIIEDFKKRFCLLVY